MVTFRADNKKYCVFILMQWGIIQMLIIFWINCTKAFFLIGFTGNIWLRLYFLATCCADGNKNQDETDIDCGGTKCSKRCDINQGCNVNSDCANNNCDQTKQTCQGSEILFLTFLSIKVFYSMHVLAFCDWPKT